MGHQWNRTSERLPGRRDDLREILALAEYHSAVALVGGLGVGVSSVLEALAEGWETEVLPGRSPEALPTGIRVVIDDGDALGRAGLQELARRVGEARGRMLVGVHSLASVPPGFVVRRLRGLSLGAATVLLARADAGVPAARLAEHVGGHPGLLIVLRGIVQSPRRPRTAQGLENALARATRAKWLEPLPEKLLRAARLLVAAGGWLPADLDVPGFPAALEALALRGLAQNSEGSAEASEILMVAQPPPASARSLRLAADVLARLRPRNPTRVRLAESWLRMHLGDEARALEAFRVSHRYARGSLRDEAYAQGLDRLGAQATGQLGAAARLTATIYRFGAPRHAGEALPRVEALLAKGGLAAPDLHEARTYLGYLSLQTDGPATALERLGQAAQEAAAEGDAYGEAQAVVWQAWIHILSEHHTVAAHTARRAVRLSRLAQAPVLQSRAHFALSRAALVDENPQSAERQLEHALRLARRYRLADDEVVILDALADLANRRGRPSEASAHLDAADAILGRAGSLPRKGDLALTRAEVALRRGHVGAAHVILNAPEVEVATEPWRRDLVRAEVAVSAAHWAQADALLRTGVRHPAQAPDWLRRRAAVAAALEAEGLKPGLTAADVEGDELARLLLETGVGASERRERLLAAPGPVVDRVLLPQLFERLLLEGRFADALEHGRLLREQLAAAAAPTALMLVLDAVSQLARGQGEAAARSAAVAQRYALSLGHRRVAILALEVLVAAHLSLGRRGGLARLRRRMNRLAAASGSPVREARAAMLRHAAALRFAETPDPVDLIRARGGPDGIAGALALRIDGGRDGAAETVGRWLYDRLIGPEGAPESWIAAVPGPAIELTLDLDRREVRLAGGKRVAFGRRRVLWRVLTLLHDAAGEAVDPTALYVHAWRLPFNQSRLNSLYVGIRRLRLLIEPDPSAPRLILAGQAGGYRMDLARVAVSR